MTRLNINASRLSALTAGVVGLLAAGFVPAAAQDQPQQQVPQGWTAEQWQPTLLR